MEATSSTVDGPFVRILEQPARCALRFRYECEGRSAGSIPGMNATAENKTYPAIQVINYKGPAVVVVSCVTKDAPYKAHPHNLVGKEGCKKGVCTVFISNPDMTCTFTSLGIQCVKRKDVEESLRLRESIKVDPFKAGFSHKTQAPNIDLNVVRLCFQVFIEGAEKDKFNVPLAPVVSHPIYDKKAMSELIISKLSHCSAPVTGGTEVVLLCDRVTKDDIQIRFHEERNGQIVWENYGEFQPNDVHKQVAISFRTPRYYDDNISHPVTVMISLRRPSDNQSSDPRPFQMLPRESDCQRLTRKRQKIDEGAFERYLQQMPSPPSEQSPMNIVPAVTVSSQFTVRVPRLMPKIKHEADAQRATATSPSPSPSSSAHLQSTQVQHQQSPLSSDCFWNLCLDQDPQSPQQQQQQQHNQVTFLAPAPVALPLVKQETNLLLTAQSQISGKRSSPFEGDIPPGPSYTNITRVSDAANTGVIDGSLSEKLDSLDLDIDPNDLINDINFNNMMVNLDSGNNITFNSSGNITEGNNTQGTSLNTPQIIDDTKNPLLAFVMSSDNSKH